MTTTGPLFDKPMAELREAFVRARFAQEDVFGMPGIEAWLAGQRKAERPIEHMWRRLIDAERVRRPFHIRELPDLAVPQELPREFPIRQLADVGDPLVAMLCESVDRKRVDVLPADKRLTLFLLKGEDGVPAHAFTLTLQSKKRRPGDPLAYTLFVPSDKDLLQVVLSRGWSVGPKKIAAAARRLLCDGLEECLREERRSAKADFDTAVAVSADGTKICSADWVCVFGASSTEPPPSDRHGISDSTVFRATDYLFPASAFREQKALLTPRTREEDLPPTGGPFGGPGTFKHDWLRHALTIENALRQKSGGYSFVNAWYRQEFAYTRCHHPRQTLLVCKDGRVLFVHRDQCPDPLPEGGIELTV